MPLLVLLEKPPVFAACAPLLNLDQRPVRGRTAFGKTIGYGEHRSFKLLKAVGQKGLQTLAARA